MALVLALLLVLALAGIGAVVLVSVGSDGAAARNQAWAAQGAAQAEAGLELAKALLAAYVEEHGSLEMALPPVRPSIGAPEGDPWGRALPPDGAACGDPATPGCRDYEVFRDEPMAGGNARVYVGRVLRDVGGRPLLFDPRAPGAGWAPDLDGDGAPDLAGVTVWIRRPVVGALGRRGAARPRGAHRGGAPSAAPKAGGPACGQPARTDPPARSASVGAGTG